MNPDEEPRKVRVTVDLEMHDGTEVSVTVYDPDIDSALAIAHQAAKYAVNASL